jgi:adenylate kinase
MLRAAIAAGTAMGQAADKVMKAGNLVSDEIINGIVAERLAEADIQAHGVLLDGFPRTPVQAEALEGFLGDGGLDLAINLEVPVAVVKARMLARGRTDDSPDAIERRLALYTQETAPLIEWFDERGLLVEVDGLGTEDEVFARLVEVIEARRSGQVGRQRQAR